MKTLLETRPNVFVAPEIDGRSRRIGVLSCDLSGFRLVLPLSGAPYVANFEALGWIKTHDVTPAEALELTANEPAVHAFAIRHRYNGALAPLSIDEADVLLDPIGSARARELGCAAAE